ncbi:MAG: radical SAM protein [Clostridiales bacterium]|nr:radical SAM protein [Clostridiales bacterium]
MEAHNFKDPYSPCNLCPRRCGADRTNGKTGFCGVDAKTTVNLSMIHRGEEPVLGGPSGCGAVFFEGCPLMCIFCQNHKITKTTGNGTVYDANGLADLFLKLASDGAGAIDLVTPVHFAPEVANAVRLAKENGLSIPVICNCSGYESVSTLKLFEGLIDIYLPDIKYYSGKVSAKYANATDYFATAAMAVDEMFRQTGKAVLDENGIMKRGLIVRHMMLPGNLFDSKHILDYLVSRFGDSIYISLMSQYTPMPHILDDENAPKELKRTLSSENYEKLCDYLADLGQTNAFVQEMSSSGSLMIPAFN